MNRCIQCMRCVRYCDEVIDSNALKGLDRGNITQPGTFMRQELECEFCGGCIQICPVGALTSRVAMYDYRPWQLKKVETVCPHCGDGCLMKLESRDEIIKRVTSEQGRGRNDGDLCARGFFGYQFINDSRRLVQPLSRRSGELVPISWYEAVPEAAQRLSQIKARHGSRSIGGIISADSTNEDAFVFQKFMRLALGSNNLDSTARLGHLNSVRALRRVLGHSRMMNSYEEIIEADLIFLVGSDVTESNPITGLKIKQAVRERGARLVTLGPFAENHGTYVSNIVNRAALPLSARAGTEGLVIRALTKAVFEGAGPDRTVEQRSGRLVQRLRQAAGALSYAEVGRLTGLGEAPIKEAASLLAKAGRAVVIVGEEIVRGAAGERDLLNLCDLLILTGKMDRAGSGINVLCGGANDQGVVEMGAAPEYLPGLLDAKDASAVERFVASWKDELVLAGGDTMFEMLDRAERGELKALILVGVDPLSLAPNPGRMRAALGRLEYLLIQDLFVSETARLAHMILPSCSYAEKEGTFTSQEGRIQRVNQAIEPVGEAKADWEIFSEIAREMQYPVEYADSGEITAEIARLVPLFHKSYRIVNQESDQKSALQRYQAEGFEQDFDRRYGPPASPAAVDRDYPFTLHLGSTLFHSGSRSLMSGALLKIQPKGILQIHPEDARRLGVAEGGRVRLKSRAGSAEAEVKSSRKVLPGTAHYPEVFASNGLAGLFGFELNPESRVPYSRTTAVFIERIA